MKTNYEVGKTYTFEPEEQKKYFNSKIPFHTNFKLLLVSYFFWSWQYKLNGIIGRTQTLPLESEEQPCENLLPLGTIIEFKGEKQEIIARRIKEGKSSDCWETTEENYTISLINDCLYITRKGVIGISDEFKVISIPPELILQPEEKDPYELFKEHMGRYQKEESIEEGKYSHGDYAKTNKPPIGIKPKSIWESERIEEIEQCFLRYLEAHENINPEWINEYNELNEKIRKSK
jgi:hypothetical protein